MKAKQKPQPASPASEVNSVDENVSTEASEVDKITLGEYLQQSKVHPGILASFRVEVTYTEALGLPKTLEEWELALEAQSSKVYNTRG